MLKGNERILIVDDDAPMLKAFATGLDRAGYQCMTAESADDADRALQREEFDLMLLDIGMPEKTGLAYLPELTRRYPDMAIVIVTGHDETSIAVLAMREGALDYVAKPVPLALLILRVEKALAHRARLAENKAYRAESSVDHVKNSAYLELELRLEQNRRELAALQYFVKENMAERQSAAEAYVKLECESPVNRATGGGAAAFELIKTGEVPLDDKLGGGVPRGSLTLIEGDSAAGKSVLCQHLIYGALMSKLAVACYSSEETLQSLTGQMRSLGMDLDKAPWGYKLSLYALEDAIPDEGGDTLLDVLAMAMDNLAGNPELIIVDAITVQASYSREKSILSFFSSCKRMCANGKTIVVVAHSSIFDEKMFVRVSAMCDGNLSLHVENDGDKISHVLEVRKVHHAKLPTSNIVHFEVVPLMGMQVKTIFSRAKA